MKSPQFLRVGPWSPGRGDKNPLATLLACLVISFLMVAQEPAPFSDTSVLRAAAFRDEVSDGSPGAAPQEGPFELAAGPDIVVSPSRFDLSVIAGKQLNETLEIRNVGSESLSFNVTVSHGAASHWQPLVFPAEKIEPGLRERLSASEEGTFLVYLEEQADLSPAFLMEDWEARGRYVFDTLRTVAQTSQRSLVEFLLVELQAGRISSFQPFYLVNVVAVTGSLSTLDTLAAYPGVAYIEAPDTYSIPEPGVSSPAPTALAWGVDRIDAERVWNELGFRGEGIVVANVDTGVMFEHDALRHQYRGTVTGSHDYNWFDPNGAKAPFDNYGHGTHTMGTMVGDDLSANQIGVAPKAQWIAAKGCVGYYCTYDDLLKSAEWILAPYPIGGSPDDGDPSKRPNVVNNSWGGSGGDLWYQQAVQNWRAAAIFPAFSAGNSGPGSDSMSSPGDYAESFASGATDSSDTIASFSSRGPSSVTNETKPDVSAPGVSVPSSWNDGSYYSISGTSMASPHAAGCAALMLSARPLVDLELLENALMATAADLGESGPDYTYGHGRIDCFAAVSEVMAPAEWLSVRPTSGSVEPGQISSLDVTVDATNLRPGAYKATIRIQSNDPDQGIVDVPVDLQVKESNAPVVTIQEPADGSSFPKGESVTFSGSATDTEDGEVSSKLSWSSDRDGSIGSGASFTTSSLSVGTHKITASVTDSDGISGEDSISITITDSEDTPPTVRITEPANGSMFEKGKPVTFSGTAEDDQDGDLTSELSWTSSRDGTIGSGGSFTTSSLSAGTHTVTASVTDSGGLSASAAISISITTAENTPPEVVITAPENGSSFAKGTPVTFSGTATDEQDGDVTANLWWWSSRDGHIGSGGSFTTSALSVGEHYIYTWAIDSGGLYGWGWVLIQITDTDSPPTVAIVAPPNGSSFDQGTPVTFSGTATDKEDGDLTANLVWTSNRDGSIGLGGSFTTSSLSVGAHTITASVTDSVGHSASASIVITIKPLNTPPTVSIVAPPNGSSFEQGTPVTFSGTATDKEDGDLAAKLVWVSNRDGSIGSGGSFTTSSLSVGAHTITAWVTDSGGLSGSASISLTITSAQNQPPEVTITAPPNMSTFKKGEPVTFSGSAIDPEDGDLTWGLLWFSTIDTTFGVGGDFTTSSLSVGQHWIFAHATDSAGVLSFDWILITITPATEGGGL